MTKLLPNIQNAMDLHGMSVGQLEQVASEIREVLCGLLSIRTAHFASIVTKNLVARSHEPPAIMPVLSAILLAWSLLRFCLSNDRISPR